MNIISVTEPEQISAIFTQLITLILELLENSFKEIKTKIGKCISVLCKSNPEEIFKFGDDLIECLTHSLKHPDFNVRVSALEALGQFIYTVPISFKKTIFSYILYSKNEKFYELIQCSKENIFSNMIRDENIQVRDMFYRVVADWIMHLSNRKDYEKILLPILLIGLFDPIGEVRETCWEQIIEIGMTWENEHYFLENTRGGESTDFKPYPWHPFLSKPRIGIRMYFIEYFQRIFDELLSEISNFMSLHKDISAKLLLSLLILTETVPYNNISLLLLSLMGSIQISDQTKEKLYIFNCLEVLGRLYSLNIYLPIITSTRTKPSIFCSILCISVSIVSVSSQISSLTYLLKGTLNSGNIKEIYLFLPKILKFVKNIERSGDSLAFTQMLLDEHSQWPKETFKEIIKLLLEHDHPCIPNYLKQFTSGEFDMNAYANELIKEVFQMSSSSWKVSNLNVYFI